MKEKKKKQTPSEVLAAIINKDLLNERRKKATKKEENDRVEIDNTTEKENQLLKWYQKPILREDFIIKKYNGKFYTKHKEWGNNIWIGAYDNIEIVNDIISSYIENSKKPILKRKLDNRIHSILINIK